jgi:hypothetical protein
MKRIAVVVLAVVSLFSACKKEVEPAPTDAKVKFGFVTNSSTVAKPGDFSSSNSLRFTTGTIKIKEINLDAKKDDHSSVKASFKQPATIDFATQTVTPEISVELTPGAYKSVKMEIKLQETSNEPTIVVEGTYVNSLNASVPIRFELVTGEGFKAEAKPVDLADRLNVMAKITFDPQYWFLNVTAAELDDAALAAGGNRILINKTTNTAIFNKVAERITHLTEAVFE